MAAHEDLGIRVGFAGGALLGSIDEVRADARWAAAVGFDSYWVSHGMGVEPMVALAVVGEEVQGIELGTSVVPMVGRHPIAVAQIARTVQQTCGGRFTLGIGPSHQPMVEGIYGEPWARPLQRTAEYLAALIPLCDGTPVDVSGEQLAAHTALNVPGDPVPIVLAALGPRMLELAGRLTTGTHVGQCGPRTIAEHTAPTIRAAAADAGRPEPRIIALVNLCVTDDPVAARAAAAEGAAMYAALPSYRAMLDREGIDDPTELILAGSIDEIVEHLRRYAEAGVTDLRLGVTAPDDAYRQSTRSALAAWVG